MRSIVQRLYGGDPRPVLLGGRFAAWKPSELDIRIGFV